MTGGAPDRREGRGQLSSIDMLPEEAEPDIVWALEELRERRMPQKEILKEFNARLADRGIAGISKSSWNRYSVRKAIQFRRLEQGHQIMAGISSNLSSDAPDQVTMVIGEMLKLAVFQQLEDGDPSSKELGELARVLRHSVKAQADTIEYRKSMADLNDRLKKVAEAVAEGSVKGGASEETLAKITSLLTTGVG